MVGFFIVVLLRVFEAGGAKGSVDTTAADGVLAGLATAQTVITGRAVARFAGRAAFMAEYFVAAGTTVRAVIAKSGATTIAEILVIF